MDFITDFIERHQLPKNFRVVAEQHYVPLCDWVKKVASNKRQSSSSPLLLGINGAQGTGKSTLADFIAENLSSSDWQVAVVSIDDFYLSKADRKKLAADVHPLLETRGVPGTHDLELAFDVIERLVSGESGVALPRFDKSMDDRFDQKYWPRTDEPVDLIIIEGWCVGSVPEAEEDLNTPINSLESIEDEDNRWRTYVNECLAADYQTFFAMIDNMILLKAPDFESVYRWRLEQEEKLAEKSGHKATNIMDADQIARFIQHYERLTRHNLKTLPEKSDVVLELNTEHQITRRLG